MYKIVLVVALALSISSCFQLFEKQKQTLAKIDLDKNRRVEANLISMGATTNDVIQIELYDGDEQRIIGKYESYNWADLKKVGSDSLLVRLSDSSSVSNNIDTQYVQLNIK